ncbi:MAG: DUF2318 domain-containing protein [Oscillospiraceae bacterium]|jgi:uncharacterized membrane protein|nr:DUF2318 domain-containing protein [Oscillospiraceae bacterium]
MQTPKTPNKRGAQKSLFVGILLALSLLLALTACSAGSGPAANNEQAAQPGDDLVIQISDISETAKFYPVTVDGTRMEVVAVKAPDGTIRTAFNTCQVCNGSPKAYFEQSGTTLQCQNCGNKFPMDRVEVEAGGCNPVPIFDTDKTVTDESITVSYATLQANVYRFPANWKK